MADHDWGEGGDDAEALDRDARESHLPERLREVAARQRRLRERLMATRDPEDEARLEAELEALEVERQDAVLDDTAPRDLWGDEAAGE